MQQFHTQQPLSLYIHMPWCIQKCPYCDFNSHQIRTEINEPVYIDALLKDIEHELPLIWGREIVSVFIGGGTPSLFSPENYDRLFSGLRALLNLKMDVEITLEANPATFEAEKFAEFQHAGINRLSIGIQSFNDTHLQSLGRIHNAHEATRAVEIAHDAGFKRINIDIMFGLPNQTADQALDDLNQAIALKPHHLSWYELTIEPNTYYYTHRPSIPEDDTMVEIFEQGRALLTENGFERYEISAYATSEHQHCLHNLNYWHFGDYIGIGAGAHGKLTLPATGEIIRRWRERNPQGYMQKINNPDNIRQHTLSAPESVGDFMLNALRLEHGFNKALFQERTGLPLHTIQKQLDIAVNKGLLEVSLIEVKPTPLGKQYLNNLIELFLIDSLPSKPSIEIKAL